MAVSTSPCRAAAAACTPSTSTKARVETLPRATGRASEASLSLSVCLSLSLSLPLFPSLFPSLPLSLSLSLYLPMGPAHIQSTRLRYVCETRMHTMPPRVPGSWGRYAYASGGNHLAASRAYDCLRWIGWHYSDLSNATCLMRPRSFYVFFAASGIPIVYYSIRHF